jgi:hypothetical protein
MPLQATSGAASYDAFGGGAPAGGGATYIEDVFSTYLYSGTNANITITNNIDLSGKGGLVWQKQRTSAIKHRLFDTVQTLGNELASNSTSAVTNAGNLTAFSSTGFTLSSAVSDVGETYVTWTFREQPKFFDIVTYTGNGVAGRTIAHNLGSTPGCMIVKCTSSSSIWSVYHRSTGGTQVGILDGTNAFSAASAYWNNTDPTSTVFTVGGASAVNDSGQTYVAYLFAHDAGGFGLTGTDNVISCGSVTLNGSGQGNVNLGYEPQWILYKRTDGAGNWSLVDSMRGWWAEPNQSGATLLANTANYEAQLGGQGSPASYPNSTGFLISGSSGQTFIYIAIRRGPMKVPTVGTSVFSPVARTANGTYTQINTTFAPDLVWSQARTPSGYTPSSIDRLRGAKKVLFQTNTNAEATSTAGFDVNNFNNTGVAVESQGEQSIINFSTVSGINWFFGRAPNFFDEVCYTGTGSNATFSHNLTVAPEMMIVKRRDTSGTYWTIYHASLGNTQRIFLNTNDIAETATSWNNTTPTASVFSVGTSTAVNGSGNTYVNYLFSSLAGVSKVGSYTGNGSTQTINCGFTSGARFVLIKSSDNYTDWYVYDTARGMTVLTDPYLLINTTGAEVATLGSVTTVSTGFSLNAGVLAAINTNGANYIFLAIA